MSKIASVLLLLISPIWAQDTFKPVEAETSELGATTVVGSDEISLTDNHPFCATNTVSEAVLKRIAQGTLGNTLGWQPGVSTSSYGQGASRPVIRGLDGFRVRILRDSVGTLDVSSSSPDHGIPIEPLLLREVEILRGPAALRYGNSALGGAVNSLTRTFTTKLPDRQFRGAFESRWDSVSSGWATAGYLDVTMGNFVLTLTGSYRDSHDYGIPGRARTDEYEERFNPVVNNPDIGMTVPIENPSDTLPNSYFQSDSQSIGLSWFPAELPIEASGAYSRFQSDFGLPYLFGGDANDLFGDSSLALTQDRFDLRLRYLPDLPWLTEATLHVGFGDYNHTENFTGRDKDASLDFIDTIFDLQAMEARLDLVHKPTDWLRGVAGFQLWCNRLKPSRLGGAPDPTSRFFNRFETSNIGFFVNETATLGDFQIHAALRWETQTIEDNSLAQSGFIREVDDTSFSTSLGGSWEHEMVGPFDRLRANLSLSSIERIPTETERFAFWDNPAIQRFLIGGDLDGSPLQTEQSLGIDLGLEAEIKQVDFRLNLFHYQIDNFTYLQDIVGIGNQAIYTQTKARLYGLEGQADWKIQEGLNRELVLSFMTDWVQANDRTNNAPLPRIPPFRFGTRLAYTIGPLQAGLEIRHAFEQDRIQPSTNTVQGELSTDGYTEINLDVSYDFDLTPDLKLIVFANLNNLLDEERRLHTSFLKDVAPLPGRNFTLGGRLEF